MQRLLRRGHLAVGVIGLAIFPVTGAYMRIVYPQMLGVDDLKRMLLRSRHIYLLLTALVNLALGMYLPTTAGNRIRRTLRSIGSLLVLPGPALLLTAFATEPGRADWQRPFSNPAVVATLVGVLLHWCSTWFQAAGRTDPQSLG